MPFCSLFFDPDYFTAQQCCLIVASQVTFWISGLNQHVPVEFLCLFNHLQPSPFYQVRPVSQHLSSPAQETPK